MASRWCWRVAGLMRHLALILCACTAARAWAETALPPRAVFTRTMSVTALASDGSRVFVGTRGGLEVYAVGSWTRERVYTTADGLPGVVVDAVEVVSGCVTVRVGEARCALVGERFACATARSADRPVRLRSELFAGRRVTAELYVGGARLVGTDGAGLWWVDGGRRRLTPEGQLCGEHVVAVAAFAGATWTATFDAGLCRYEDGRFVAVEGAFGPLVNDLLATPDGTLYVASTRGLWRTRDGRSFRRVPLFDGRGVNDLAWDGRAVWATTPATLWRIQRGREPWPYRTPGGSLSLQAVDARAGVLWLASEDRGAIAMRSPGRFEVFDRAAGLPTSWSLDVAVADDGGAWVATLRHGLVRVGADGRVASVPVPDPWLLHVSTDASGALAVGAQGGAVVLGREGGRAFADLPNANVHAVATMGEEVWVGTEGGAAVYDRR